MRPPWIYPGINYYLNKIFYKIKKMQKVQSNDHRYSDDNDEYNDKNRFLNNVANISFIFSLYMIGFATGFVMGYISK